MSNLPLNLGGAPVKSVMTTGQLLLAASCMNRALRDHVFTSTLSEAQLTEARIMIRMFSDPSLEVLPRDVVHGFCV